MKRRTGYVFEERCMWHYPGCNPGQFGSHWVEPCEFWENVDTKRRFHNLLAVSGVLNSLVTIRARVASKEDLLLFHTVDYVSRIEEQSRSGGGDGGELAPFAPGGYDIAALSAGGVLAAVDAVLAGTVDNAYCLVRPPGHHAEANRGRGFCIFNNIAIAAKYALNRPFTRAVATTAVVSPTEYSLLPPAGDSTPELSLTLPAEAIGIDSRYDFSNDNASIAVAAAGVVRRIAIVDYDVHHGNGTQEAFWSDPNVLFISLHQHHNYPQDSGDYTDIGDAKVPGAVGTTINIPLPPGCGSGAYFYAFERIVIPALHRFAPDLLLVSSGFDASYADPLGSMMLSSDAFRCFAEQLIAAADSLCGGRIVFAHEGGYSKDYVPFCGIAVVEALRNERSAVVDDYLPEVQQWGYQELQPHQFLLIEKIAQLHNLPPPPPATFPVTTTDATDAVTTTTDAATVTSTGGPQMVLQQMQQLLDLVSDPEQKKSLLRSLAQSV